MGFKNLESKIKEQAQKYYTDGSNDLTDKEFDQLVDELKKTNLDSEVLKTGWGYDINQDSTPGEKVKHKYGHVGSLDKCRAFIEMKPVFRDHSDMVMSLKLDGISVVLYYEAGKLIRALTRGDGELGIDIRDKVLKIYPSLCRTNQSRDFTGAVRGEILMSFSNFESFKVKHPEAKNARNSTAGLINAKDVSDDDLRYLDIFVYTVVGDENLPETLCDQTLDMRFIVGFLRRNFDKVAPYAHEVLTASNLDSIMTKLKNGWYGIVPADGIVITHDVKYNRESSEIQYNAMAYKFESEIGTVTVEEVEWNMSKTRYAIPRIRYSPVQLAGTTVEFATGYNAEYIKNNNIGKGSIVNVEKRGEIIPNIVGIVRSNDHPDIIDRCPDCGEPLSWSGVHLVCTNSDCINAKTQDLLVWLNELSPLDNFGDKLRLKFLQQVFDQDEITIEDVMNAGLDRLVYSTGGDAQYQLFVQMCKTLYQSEFTLVSAIKALNIPRFGDKNSAKLAKYPEYARTIFSCAMDTADDEEHSNLLEHCIYYPKMVVDIGEANMKVICQNLEKFKRWRYIHTRINFDSESRSKAEFKGKVCITGKLSVKRSDFEKELTAAGFTVGEIAKDTKFLITDDPNSSSSKNKKATEWGIVKISEQNFRKEYL